jgi:hypothetical protein
MLICYFQRFPDGIDSWIVDVFADYPYPRGCNFFIDLVQGLSFPMSEIS